MALTAQPKILPWLMNRALDATITASVSPDADTPLTNFTDPRPGRRVIFPGTAVDIDFDLGARSPWNINFSAMLFKNLSTAATVAFKSKATVGAGYTTHGTITLWPPTTSDGFDGFGFEERPFDEYPSELTKKYPTDPPYFCLHATEVNHRWWRVSVTDIGNSQIEASVPLFYNMWEIPTNTTVTTSVARGTLDNTTTQEGPLGSRVVNPGTQRKTLRWDLGKFQPAEAWEELSYFFEQQGQVLPYFVILAPTASGSNIINTTDDAGRKLLHLMGYGTLTEIPDIGILSGYGDNYVDVLGFSLEEMK